RSSRADHPAVEGGSYLTLTGHKAVALQNGSVETLPPPLAHPGKPAALPAAANTEDTPTQLIDLASALGMAGGNAWTIQLARQRTLEAHADLKAAKALWLPSLQAGIGWNKHDGRIQATQGQVLDASRGSLFAGAGATLGAAPIAGGTNGPLRLSADLALADAYFGPQIANRQVAARRAGVSIAKSRAQLDAGLAYVDLLEATGQLADAQTAISAANELLNLTKTFERAGAGALADVDRAATEQARLSQQLANSQRLYRTRSAALARRLRLDPRFTLQVADQVLVPIELATDANDVNTLIATALSQRPEVSELHQEIAGLCVAVRKANVEPWIPRVAMTTSAGSFGGGQGSDVGTRSGRSDVDLQAVWQVDNLGVGVVAKRNRAASQLAQKRMSLADLRDQITSDVVAAYENVQNYRHQITAANQAMALSKTSYQRNLQRVRASEGLPIELLQAISARAESLRDRTAAVAGYNRAQLQLLFATAQLR
ncbi:MAG: TolC family protein, partial [Pirellulaceae bacterium]|nr:TolC family protein [Pirellulaceae bacterium]